jgi:prepilin-type N-terminal cleavage/methylation domain-containing protein
LARLLKENWRVFKLSRTLLMKPILQRKKGLTSLIPEGFPIHRAGTPPAPPAFSLVELLMVVAIMGILMGIGFAVAPGVLKSSAMSGGLSQVASAVSLARSEAIRSRNPTYFVLAPTNPLDERSFRSYSIIQATSPRSTNFTYISRWEKLPQAVLFKLDQDPSNSNRLATMNFPYPADGGAPISLPCIAFQGDGALLEDLHTVGNLPRIALQTGVRMNPGDAPTYQGSYLTNEVGVRRVTGKVFVEREK